MSASGRRVVSNLKSKGKKKANAPQPSSTPATNIALDTPESSLKVLQLILDIFAHSFQDRLGDELPSTLQQVKKHLYDRDFQAAFGKDEYLEAYAARWSPGRALSYTMILHRIIGDHLTSLDPEHQKHEVLKVVSVGGGAGAEIAAFAAALHLLQQDGNDRAANLEQSSQDQQSKNLAIECLLLDIAKWDTVVDALSTGVVTATPISRYATDAAKAAIKPLLARDDFAVNFKQVDALDTSGSELKHHLHGRDLITIFFTLNELYTTSLPRTQTFLLNLTASVDAGTLLLVIDSAGSYSSVSLNGKEKKYPMHWLLDHALLKPQARPDSKSAEANAAWEKVQENESQWFRVPETLRYPLELENMRYQLHLYRRL